MSNVMKNFRAKDMPGGGGSRSGVQRRPKPTQLPAETVPQPQQQQDDGRNTQLDAEQRGDTVLDSPPPQNEAQEVPAGTTAEILQWVGSDKGRAQQALDAEQGHPSPRHGLTGELNKILSE